MFNQQKPAFKFVIKSKIEQTAATDVKQDAKKDATAAASCAATTAVVSDEKKRKRTEKDITAAAPIATKKVRMLRCPLVFLYSNHQQWDSSKKVYSQLERWNRKKQELKHESDLETEQEMAKSEYADLSAMACLLCQRKFKQKADLERHQAISELHKVQHIQTHVFKMSIRYCLNRRGGGGAEVVGGGERGRERERAESGRKRWTCQFRPC